MTTIIITAVIVAPSFTILGVVAGLWWAHVREEARIDAGFQRLTMLRRARDAREAAFSAADVVRAFGRGAL